MQALLKFFSTWLFQLRAPERGEIVLVQRRIFILPTRAGLVYAGVLVLMLTGSINYALSLGFVLTFLLGSVGMTAMLHTFRNLAGLRISPGKTAPVFAGENARFSIAIHNPSAAPRYSLAVARDKQDTDIIDVPPASTVSATATVPAVKRGRLQPGRLTLYSRYPIGLYNAWSYVNLDMYCLVYPRPAPPGLPLPVSRSSSIEGAGQGHGHDDFAGLRQYQPGDSPRHIAWKSAARGDVLLTKQFTGRAAAEIWLNLELLPTSMGLEEKLSRLTRWVLDAHAGGLAYGMKLPNATVALGSGEAHRDRCLEALALL
jgi:uncharacterized protein (DUF58 family)